MAPDNDETVDPVLPSPGNGDQSPGETPTAPAHGDNGDQTPDTGTQGG